MHAGNPNGKSQVMEKLASSQGVGQTPGVGAGLEQMHCSGDDNMLGILGSAKELTYRAGERDI